EIGKLSLLSRIIIKQPKCLCPSTYSKEIQLNRIQKFVIIAPGPHCRNLEKVVDVCVNPSDQWVQDVMKIQMENPKSNCKLLIL
uniref:Chemokine interleukin-8-like domain-containing protein n=1 Tax=Pygocentrus nattereri TaxID=42514 RepID=A0AAR2LJB1_PYGNA